MRGRRSQQITMLAFIDLEERVPTGHRCGRSNGWLTPKVTLEEKLFPEPA